MYTISELATLSGVSTRTLRYYDDIGLLKPTTLTEAGYRLYDKKKVDRLQQILWYKEMDFSLARIKELITQPDDALIQALENQYHDLQREQQLLQERINTIQHTILYYKGEQVMSDKEKFEAFKQQKIDENNELYGKEVTETYGEDALQQANSHWKHMSEETLTRMTQQETLLFDCLKQLDESTSLPNPVAEKAFLAHKNWLLCATPTYSKEYHRGLLEMYTMDERFAAYYLKHITQSELTNFQRIVNFYTK